MGLDRPARSRIMEQPIVYVGLNLHMDTVAAAFAQACKRGELRRALSREPNLARAKIGSPNSGSGCGSSSPRLESFFSEDAERAAGCEMALDVESVLDDGVNGQEALS